MAVVPRVWGTPSVEYATDAYSGIDADVSTEATLADIDFVTGGSGFNADDKHGVSLKFKVNSSGTTDNFDVLIYTSDDGTEFDTLPVSQMQITATSGADVIATFLVPAVARHIRVRGKRSGSTDSFDVELTVSHFTYGE